VRNGYGEGRTVRAKAAVDLGMADRVATLDETFMRLSGGGRVKRRAAAEVIEIRPTAADPEPPAAVSLGVTETATVNDSDDIDLRERELDLR
jgi:hypothetical protein